MIRITKPEQPNPLTLSIRQEMVFIIHSCNNVLTDETLQNYDFVMLLRNIHPLYRKDYADKLRRNENITEEEYKSIYPSEKR